MNVPRFGSIFVIVPWMRAIASGDVAAIARREPADQRASRHNEHHVRATPGYENASHPERAPAHGGTSEAGRTAVRGGDGVPGTGDGAVRQSDV